MIKNYKIKLEYDGTRYHGWQKQKNTEATIQGKLEALLYCMTGMEIEVQGAGRTDAGVHASGQIANFKIKTEDFDQKVLEEIKKLEKKVKKEKLSETEDAVFAEAMKVYMNHYLPADIRILYIKEEEIRFHSRLMAKEKTYCYRIRLSEHESVFSRRYETLISEHLDIQAMEQASKKLIGKHDFKAFSTNRRMKKSTQRWIYNIVFQMPEEELLEIFFTGNGFLYNMVRIMTGTLIEIGLGKRKAESIDKALESGNREDAGYTASAIGLTLISVKYENSKG